MACVCADLIYPLPGVPAMIRGAMPDKYWTPAYSRVKELVLRGGSAGPLCRVDQLANGGSLGCELFSSTTGHYNYPD